VIKPKLPKVAFQAAIATEKPFMALFHAPWLRLPIGPAGACHCT